MTVKCRTCGEEYSEYGDGWDSECPSCADITYEREEAEDAGAREADAGEPAEG